MNLNTTRRIGGGKMPHPWSVHRGVDQPNPLPVLFNVARVLITTSRPDPKGNGEVDHDGFSSVLVALDEGGLPAVAEQERQVDHYITELSAVLPNGLTPGEALAFWLNLYNAAAVRLAIEAFHRGEGSVLGIPGGFSRDVVTVASEDLSLDAIEHAKLRRLRDPRIHGALVCGSLSCPTLRAEPYHGSRVDSQLDDQMRTFLADGAAVARNGRVMLSRIFLWYGADFVRPRRMPTLIPASGSKTLQALSPWLPEEIDRSARVGFQPYDWSLACFIG